MGEPFWISIDPGGENKKALGHNGWAIFTLKGDVQDMGVEIGNQAMRETFMRTVWDCQGVICEDWKLRPDMVKAFIWSDMPTAKLIGWLQGICEMRSIPFILQQPSVKPTGYKWWGKSPLPKSNDLNHAYDAVAHGYYYFVNNKIRIPNV